MPNPNGNPDIASVNRDKTHCPHGHPYDERNTYWHGGRRYCRTCRRLANRRARAAKRTERRAS